MRKLISAKQNINTKHKMMNTAVDRIVDIANQLQQESEKKIIKYYEWVEFITPLFERKFKIDYRAELHSMYSGEVKTFVETKKREFNESYSNSGQLRLL